MDARLHPRTPPRLAVGLHCSTRDMFEMRCTHDISMGGMFVGGNSCAQVGNRLQLSVRHHTLQDHVRIEAEVARVMLHGFSLRFTGVSEESRSLLEKVIWPKWDGRNLCESILIAATRLDDTSSLADWLKLTSLVCNQYQRCCRYPAARSPFSPTPPKHPATSH